MENPDLNDQTNRVDLLSEAFLSFNQATSKLKKAYTDLKKKIDSLNLELEKKNRELEDNLREKEEVKNYLNNILESLTTGVIVINPEGEITIFNKMAERITGYYSREVINKSFKDSFGPCFSSDKARGGYLNFDSGFFEGEMRFIRKNKKRLHLKVSTSTVMNSQKKMISTIMILQDISKLKRLEEQAGRSSRLMAMGEMAAKIVHEVKNPLGSIELFASLLRQDLADDIEKEKLAGQILNGVKGIDHVVSNLLFFTKFSKPSFKKINVHEFLDEAITFTRHVTNKGEFNLVRRYNCQKFEINGDPELLRQLFLNIILNGIQAMSSGGELIISTGKDFSEFNFGPGSKPDLKIQDKFLGNLGFFDLSDSSFENKIPARRFGEIKFIDSGMGIDCDIMDKIFDPFFTTKEKGMGLGLSIVNNIVDLHGGTMEVENLLQGKGAVFTLNLPLFKEN